VVCWPPVTLPVRLPYRLREIAQAAKALLRTVYKVTPMPSFNWYGLKAMPGERERCEILRIEIAADSLIGLPDLSLMEVLSDKLYLISRQGAG
jgi:hypothetical protein